MKKIPANSKYYPKIGIILADWEVEFFQYLANGYTIEEVIAMSGKTRRQYEWLIYKVLDDTGINNKVQLIAELIRKKVIK